VNRTERARKWFIRTALAYLGTPYRWGGDDPTGFDCSGLVVEALKSVGLLGEDDDLTADGLVRLFSEGRVDLPGPGCLLFELADDGRASHVVICLDRYFQIGASGGGRETSDAACAARDNAFVKIRPLRLHTGRYLLIDPFLRR
jgi:cell wall-associated NlpC family hydrolase